MTCLVSVKKRFKDGERVVLGLSPNIVCSLSTCGAVQEAKQCFKKAVTSVILTITLVIVSVFFAVIIVVVAVGGSVVRLW